MDANNTRHVRQGHVRSVVHLKHVGQLGFVTNAGAGRVDRRKRTVRELVPAGTSAKTQLRTRMSLFGDLREGHGTPYCSRRSTADRAEKHVQVGSRVDRDVDRSHPAR